MIIIETDLEPDDIITIAYIISKNRNEEISFVLGEGDCNLKLILLQTLLSSLYFQSSTVILGFGSHEKYPTDFLPLKQWSTFNQQAVLLSENEILKAYQKLYMQNNVTICYFLKPPREALLSVDSIDFSEISCYSYGGFNYKVTGYGHDQINYLAAKFKLFYHFSRKSELNGQDSLYLAKALLHKGLDKFSEFSKIVIRNWNLHYLSRFNPSVEIKSLISTNLEIQIVIADILCIFPDEVTSKGYLVDFESVIEDERGPITFSKSSPSERNQSVRDGLDNFLYCLVTDLNIKSPSFL